MAEIWAIAELWALASAFWGTFWALGGFGIGYVVCFYYERDKFRRRTADFVQEQIAKHYELGYYDGLAKGSEETEGEVLAGLHDRLRARRFDSRW